MLAESLVTVLKPMIKELRFFGLQHLLEFLKFF
jgi:hypothetical protein